MMDFLSSYWWILFILILLISLILKSLKKIVLSLILITVLFIIFWQLFISSAFIKSEQCFANETDVGNDVYENAASMEPGIERNQYLCSMDSESLNRLTSCLELVKQTDKLGFIIYSKVTKFNKIIDESFSTHNDMCTDSQLTKPVF